MTKTILCYGASNTWALKPGSYNFDTMLAQRFDWDERWPGILQQKLGNDYHVVEEGRNGRSTQYDDPLKPWRNGLKDLPLCLESHYPVDLLILMLGTNDTKTQFNQSAKEIAEGMRKCVQVITKSNKGREGKAPEVLIIAPQPIGKITDPNSQFDENSIQKSKEMPTFYQHIAEEEGCEFLDAGLYVISSTIDALHLEAHDQQALAEAVFGKIKK